MAKHTCCYVLSNVGEMPVRYCGAPTGYTMQRDDDNRLVRKYRAFCDEHQKIVDAEDND